MTLGALDRELQVYYKDSGVESDTQIKVKLPNGEEFFVKGTELVNRKNPFGSWQEVVLNATKNL